MNFEEIELCIAVAFAADNAGLLRTRTRTVKLQAQVDDDNKTESHIVGSSNGSLGHEADVISSASVSVPDSDKPQEKPLMEGEEVNKTEKVKQFIKYTKEELIGLSNHDRSLLILINEVPKELVKDKRGEEVNKTEKVKQFIKKTKEKLMGLSKHNQSLLITDVPKELGKDKNATNNNNTSSINNSNLNWMPIMMIPQPPSRQQPSKIVEMRNFGQVELQPLALTEEFNNDDEIKNKTDLYSPVVSNSSSLSLNLEDLNSPELEPERPKEKSLVKDLTQEIDEDEEVKTEMAKQFIKYTKDELMGLSKAAQSLLINVNVPQNFLKDGKGNCLTSTSSQAFKVNKKVELHKAENPWKSKRGAVDNDTDISEQIVRHARGLLNKLTPDNFDRLVVKFLNLPFEDNEERISSVVHLMFEKITIEPLFSTVYANMVYTICQNYEESFKLFRTKFLDQCLLQFLKTICNCTNDDTDVKKIKIVIEKTDDESRKQSLKEELEEKLIQKKRKSLGNVRFIGELYILQMLTPVIIMECVTMLLSMDEENLECLCILLTTVGLRLENQIKDVEFYIEQQRKRGQVIKYAPEHRWFDKTFNKLYDLSKNKTISFRIRFALLNVHELRQNSWMPRLDSNTPTTTTIEEMRRDGIRQEQEEKMQLEILRMSMAAWETKSSPLLSPRPRHQQRPTVPLKNSFKRVNVFPGEIKASTSNMAEIVQSLSDLQTRVNAQKENVYPIQKSAAHTQQQLSRDPCSPKIVKNPVFSSVKDNPEPQDPNNDIIRSILCENCIMMNSAQSSACTEDRFKGQVKGVNKNEIGTKNIKYTKEELMGLSKRLQSLVINVNIPKDLLRY